MVKKIKKLLRYYNQAQLSILLNYSNRSSLTRILKNTANLPKSKYGIIEILLREVDDGVIRNVVTSKDSISRTKTIWSGMLWRCSSSKIYINKNIKVCERWRVFENFLEDMGEAPDNMSIDRIDNNKGYFKENCRWATSFEQASNKDKIKLYDFEGDKLTKTEIIRRLKNPYA